MQTDRASATHTSTSRASIGLITPSHKLKVTGNGTRYYTTYGLLVVELFDVEYHRDLEMWVRGHSRSFKTVPFASLGTVSYLPSIVTMAVSLAI